MAAEGSRHVVGGARFTAQAGVGLSLLPPSNAATWVSSACSSSSAPAPLRGRFNPLAWLHAAGEGAAAASSARARFVPPLACIAAAATAVAKSKRAAATVREPHTGLPFPSEYCTLEALDSDDAECQRLSGLGVRVKKILIKSIQVYAVGIYVDHAAALAALGDKYTPLGRAAVSRSAWLARDVLARDDVEKSVRLVMWYKNIKASDIKNALTDSLRPRMRGGATSNALLAKFGRQFDGVQLQRGTPVHFAWRKGHRLTTMVDGREVGTIVSQDLCHALFGLYMGDGPVAPEAKQSFQKALAQTLTA
eukprot:jgi/Chlat1/1329/Chrsp118S01755